MNEFIRTSITDKELLQECRVDTYCSSGKGGQHVNRTESAVRLVHIITGIVVICHDERSQLQNKRKCLIKLRHKLKLLSYRMPKRIPTKTPRIVKEKILEKKKRNSIIKKLRKKPSLDD